jgi:ribosomal protein L35
MPKIKTKKSVVKRFHQTATGKLMHRHTSRAHSMVKKAPSRSRRLIKESVMHPGKNKAIHRQIPNGANF